LGSAKVGKYSIKTRGILAAQAGQICPGKRPFPSKSADAVVQKNHHRLTRNFERNSLNAYKNAQHFFHLNFST
jgi:hypothetical protein